MLWCLLLLIYMDEHTVLVLTTSTFSQRSSQAGFSHWGSHTAGQVGSSQFHLQSGKHCRHQIHNKGEQP